MAKDLTDAAARAMTDMLKARISQMQITRETKALLLFIADNTKAMLDFGIAYARQRATGSVNPDELMLAFLKSRGKSLKDFGIKVIDNQTIADANAVLNLILDIRGSLKYSAIPLVGIALAVGFLINDAGKFLANFTPAQLAYYNLFLRDSNTTYRLRPDRITGPKY